VIRGNDEPFNRLAFNESIETRSLPTLTHVLPPISTPPQAGLPIYVGEGGKGSDLKGVLPKSEVFRRK
jgi:hypothetical protein